MLTIQEFIIDDGGGQPLQGQSPVATCATAQTLRGLSRKPYVLEKIIS